MTPKDSCSHVNTETLFPSESIFSTQTNISRPGKRWISPSYCKSPEQLVLCTTVNQLQCQITVITGPNWFVPYTQQVLEEMETVVPFTGRASLLPTGNEQSVVWSEDMNCWGTSGIWITINLTVESLTIAKIHPPWKKNKCLLHNIKFNSTKCSSYAQPRTLSQQVW